MKIVDKVYFQESYAVRLFERIWIMYIHILLVLLYVLLDIEEGFFMSQWGKFITFKEFC